MSKLEFGICKHVWTFVCITEGEKEKEKEKIMVLLHMHTWLCIVNGKYMNAKQSKELIWRTTLPCTFVHF